MAGYSCYGSGERLPAIQESRGGGEAAAAQAKIQRKEENSLRWSWLPASETTMACRALALQLHQLLPHTAPSHPRAAAASPARARRRASSVRCCAAAGDQGEPPQDAVLKAISQVASSKGRVARTTNVIMGGTVTDDATDEWLILDKQVNSYPTVRGFTAIGTGGDDFVQSMVVAVESVVQERIPKGQISQKVSSKGKYVSVKIGPIRVVSSEQVQAVYNAMKKDDRMKFFL